MDRTEAADAEKYTYIRCKHNGYRLKVLPEYADGELLDICCADDIAGCAGMTHVKSSVYAEVFRFEFRGKTYFHKTSLPRNYKEPIKEALLGSRSARALRGYILLSKNGFNAPVVAMIGRKGQRNFMLTEGVADSATLLQFIKMLTAPSDTDMPISLRELLVEIGHTVGRLHRSNISHGDMRWNNLLLGMDQDGGLVCNFIDNERTVKHIRLPNRLRQKNLVQLNMFADNFLSNADRMRFFNAYLEENPAIAAKKRYWIRRVERKTAWRYAQRGRPAR